MTSLPKNMLKAKMQLLFRHPFFATLLFQLKFIEDKNLNPPTAAVDGIHFFYHPEFMSTLDVDELMGTYAHEVLHCSLQHPTRIGKRDHKKWNRACDYAVNLLVEDCKLILPRNITPCYDVQYRNMTAEHIYDLLPDQPTGESNCDFGQVIAPTNEQGKELTAGEVKQLNGKWELAVNDAKEIAKQQGKLPNILEELVEQLNKSQIPWQQKLRLFMTDPAKGDYTWSRPNRRHIWNGLYLPTNYTHALGTIVWVTDSSGSVGQAEFKQFGGEFNAVVEETQPSNIWAMFCDTELHGIKEYTVDDFPLGLIKPIGRGGTHFNKPFEWVEEQGINPACLVYLTDLWGSCTVKPPNYPVLWVCTTNESEVPFGEVTHVHV
jgi:predicted metal-dependent peptidase